MIERGIRLHSEICRIGGKDNSAMVVWGGGAGREAAIKVDPPEKTKQVPPGARMSSTQHHKSILVVHAKQIHRTGWNLGVDLLVSAYIAHTSTIPA